MFPSSHVAHTPAIFHNDIIYNTLIIHYLRTLPLQYSTLICIITLYVAILSPHSRTRWSWNIAVWSQWFVTRWLSRLSSEYVRFALGITVCTGTPLQTSHICSPSRIYQGGISSENVVTPRYSSTTLTITRVRCDGHARGQFRMTSLGLGKPETCWRQVLPADFAVGCGTRKLCRDTRTFWNSSQIIQHRMLAVSLHYCHVQCNNNWTNQCHNPVYCCHTSPTSTKLISCWSRSNFIFGALCTDVSYSLSPEVELVTRDSTWVTRRDSSYGVTSH